ncbi:MAG: hypothetical protein U0822_16995 [Anaerolineae bacterium]
MAFDIPTKLADNQSSTMSSLTAREEGHGMYLINRAVVIIKPRQPFLDWANSLPDPT